MSDYGVLPSGFVRKPLNQILTEIEASLITEFGPGLIQTPQTPLGQLNGLMSDLIAELWERLEDVYQSYDPDQAEGVRLDMLGRIRLLGRGSRDDAIYRAAITNLGQARVDIQDLEQALLGLDGVTFARVYVNETGEVTNEVLQKGSIAVAIIGGDEAEIANAMRLYVVPGITTYGNTMVSSEIDGRCRSMNIIRPIEVPVRLTITVRLANDRYGCPPPSPIAIRDLVVSTWATRRSNGDDVSYYAIRSIIESTFSNVEVLRIEGERDNLGLATNQSVDIAFIEIASLATADVHVEVS